MASAVVLETYPIKAFLWSGVYVFSKNTNIYRPGAGTVLIVM